MKLLSKIFLAFGLLVLVPNLAHAQGVTRVCTELTGANGSNNCTDVSATNPFPVTATSTPGAATYIKPGAYTPLGYQQITAGTLASATALTVPTGATIAVIEVEAANVRWRDDGTSPTASVGMILSPNNVLTISGAAELAAIKFILQSGSPILDISYYN